MALVLVTDDHIGLAGAVAALVQSAGHDAAMVHSGAAALEFIRSRSVDAVILDVSMPGMSGLEVLSTLASDGWVPGLPVIVYSASELGRHEAMRLGAVGFALKDGDAEDLVDLVIQHVEVGNATA